MDSTIIDKHQGVPMIKCEPECQCDVVKCEEEILEGISSNSNLNEGLLGHQVKIGQYKAVCKEEPVELVNTVTEDIFSTIDRLAQGHDIKREDEILERVAIKAVNEIVDNDGVETEVPDANCEPENIATNEESCKLEEIFTMRDKPDFSIKQEISQGLTTSLSVKTRGTNKSKIRRVLTHSSPDDLNVNRELDCESLLMLSSSLHRPCFVNMCDNNVLYNSQQQLGEIKKTIHRKKRNTRKSKISLDLPKLKSHRPCNSRIHKCNACNYSSPYLSSLTEHKRTHKCTHTGSKPYRCDKCPYAATYAGNLVTHKRRHTGEKSYRCDKCPYAAAHAGNLVIHKRRHTGEKPYRCDKCPYTATHAGSLQRHKRTHTAEKPYRCDICPYAAARSCHLLTHKRTHTCE